MMGTTREQSKYAAYCRPKLSALLESLRLDTTFTRARGAYLYRSADDGAGEEEILDLVGGFGAGLLGHNNPELKKLLESLLDRDVPFMAQSSSREEAGRLAERLGELLPGNDRYICHLANSGAEAVEAVLKHAYKVRFDYMRRLFDRIARDIEEFYQQTNVSSPDIEIPGGDRDLARFRDDIDEHNLAELERFQNNPVVLALKGAFHGKTAGPLKITFNKTYREGFEGLSSIRPDFLDPSDLGRLGEIIARHQVEFLVPALEDGRIVLRPESACTVIALCLEIVQGEGGLRPVPEEALRALAAQRATFDVPVMVDEIQTGCGRTGSFVAYSEGPLRDIAPEYVTLGKALGGGLVKVAAALIREDVYDQDFGILHTSTYAEDEIGCAVSRHVLHMLSRDGARLMESVRRKGDLLLSRLQELQREFPDVIREVRGRGLMLGVELTDLADKSPFFRFGARQGFLSLVMASYLLHYHRIRILSPLTTLLKGNPGKKRMSVLRVQPAECISKEDVDHLLAALREVCVAVSRNNEGVLVGHLLGIEIGEAERVDPAVVPVEYPPCDRHADFDARVGFVMHPIGVHQVARFYLPSLEGRIDPKRLADWWNRLARFLEPDVVHTDYIRSEGFTVEANLVLVPYLPRHLSEIYTRARRGDQSSRVDRLRLVEIQDKVQDAVTVAKEIGDDHIPTSVVGLGAYTSIVTERGTTINHYEVPITTGNAYTAGLMVQGILRAAAHQGISLPDSRAAIVGAAGNIGAAHATMLCTRVGWLKLIGRGGRESIERLRKVRLECLQHLCSRAREQVESGVRIEDVRVGGVGDRILREIFLPALSSADSGSERKLAEAWIRGDAVSPMIAELLEHILDDLGGEDCNGYLTVHESVDAARDCDIVLIATSSPDSRLIGPDTVKPGAVVSCASVPSNLSDAFRDHLDEYAVFDGGYARLPEGHELRFVGLPQGGLAHGCFSETLLLGFDGCNASFARGRLLPEQVDRTLALADLYGFELGELIMVDTDRQHLTNGSGRGKEAPHERRHQRSA